MAPVVGDFEIVYRSDFAPSSFGLPSGTGSPLDVPRGSNGPRVSIELNQAEHGGDPVSGASANGKEGRSWPGFSKPFPRGSRSAFPVAGSEGTPAGHVGFERRHISQVSHSLNPSIAAERRTQGFKIGDMVWGKIKSHPWWPGQVYHEAFAEPHVLWSKVKGYVLVAFFGDSTFGWFDPVGDELISFERNFAEKSKQSKLGDFLKAVNESVDEVSRRGALTICCSCRTKFSPADVEGYVEVDVAGYEEGGMYPAQLIMELRSSFRPAKLVSFVRELALAPQGTKPNTLDYVKSKAALNALRRRVFQERDAPYAEPFGYTEKQLYEMALTAEDQLDGSPTQDGGKNSSVPTVKKSKLLLKRKEEVTTSGQWKSRHPFRHVPPLPRPPAIEKPPAPRGEPSDSAKPMLKHKQSGAGVPVKSSVSGVRVGQRFVHGMIKKVQVPMAPPAEDMKGEYMRKLKKKALSRDTEDGERVMKAQTLKRQIEGVIEDDMRSQKKKKTAVHGAVTDRPQHLKKSTEMSMGIKHFRTEEASLPIPKMETGSISESSPDPAPCRDAEQLMKSIGKDAAAVKATYISPKTDQDAAMSDHPPSLDLPRLVSNLLALATDTFHGVDTGVPTAVLKSILKYRSLVLKMSLPSAGDMSFPMHLIPAAPEVEEEKKRSPLINREPNRMLERSKRERSERLGELSVKRAKRVELVRDHLTEKKKAVIAEKKKPERTVHEDPKDMGSALIPSNPANQQEKPQQKAPSPAFLVMKFPAGSRLPTVPLLKAKFARFGPLEADATRIYGNTSTCKVLFKQWPDAMKAYNIVRSRDFFGGELKVLYSIKDALVPAGPQEIPNGKRKMLGASSDDAGKLKLGNGSGIAVRRPSSLPQLEPKSCLKKPDKEGGSSSAKEGSRVRFADEGGVRDRPPPAVASPVAATGKFGTWGGPNLASALPPRATFLPPGRSQPAAAAVRRRPADSRHDRSGFKLEGTTGGGMAPTGVDISGELMSLLTRCYEIVSVVKSISGFRPYHQL